MLDELKGTCTCLLSSPRDPPRTCFPDAPYAIYKCSRVKGPVRPAPRKRCCWVVKLLELALIVVVAVLRSQQWIRTQLPSAFSRLRCNCNRGGDDNKLLHISWALTSCQPSGHT